MPYCSDCGVEVEKFIEVCPLCAAPIRNGREPEVRKDRYPDRAAVEKRSGMYRLIAWECVSVFLLTAAFIVLFTNLLINLSITWAWYPLASFALAWLLVTFPLLFQKRPVPIATLSAIAILLYLAGIDFIDDHTFDWFQFIALPIAFLVGTVTVAVVTVSSRAKKKGANVAAYILFGVGLVVLGIDMIIGFAITRKVGADWSSFVIIPLVFIAFFLLYLHHRLLNHVNLKKWFQL